MPNRDQRRRDGTFEYAQLNLAPASDEPARCEHGQRGGAHAWQRSADGVLGWACMSLNPGPAASGTPDGGQR